jgi:hypothetical protein
MNPVYEEYIAAKHVLIEAAGDDVKELARIEAQVDGFLRGLGPVYELRKELRQNIASLQGPIKLPKPRLQTDTQRRVSACPRCGSTSIPDKEAVA